jgi:hypothetical protein
VEANSTGGQGSRRAVAPSDDDNDNEWSFIRLTNFPGLRDPNYISLGINPPLHSILSQLGPVCTCTHRF